MSVRLGVFIKQEGGRLVIECCPVSMDLEIAIDHVTYDEVEGAFTKVSGKDAKCIILSSKSTGSMDRSRAYLLRCRLEWPNLRHSIRGA
jgi:hypothetical protein